MSKRETALEKYFATAPAPAENTQASAFRAGWDAAREEFNGIPAKTTKKLGEALSELQGELPDPQRLNELELHAAEFEQGIIFRHYTGKLVVDTALSWDHEFNDVHPGAWAFTWTSSILGSIVVFVIDSMQHFERSSNMIPGECQEIATDAAREHLNLPDLPDPELSFEITQAHIDGYWDAGKVD